MSGAWAFHWHPLAWAGIIAALAAYVAARRLGGGTAAQGARFGGGLAAVAVASTWPVADIGRRSSFTAQLGAHLLLALGAAPLLIGGLPVAVTTRLTARRWSDALARGAAIPLVAGLASTSVLVAVHLPPVVNASVSSSWLSGIVELAVLAAGGLLWVPVLGLVPGARRLGTGGRIGYLVAVSILPNVPGSFLTFAGSPVYDRLIPGARSLGIDPTLDCQLAGALAKIVAAGVLWAAATAIFFRTFRAEQDGTMTNPLEWADVERAFQRADWRRRSDEQAAAPPARHPESP